ncbi:hypothetical protein AwErysi_09170 [Erysipelotrichaceae bacterium]|nr:hypothetical protein AwErysi_09170 [Erysipelotrichaceae bacterium]
MQKNFKILFSLMLVTILSVSTLANSNSRPLYRFVKNDDGMYGYDNSIPINYHSNSTEQIMIPIDYTQKKEQFKATWVATISNLNIEKPQSEADFQEKYTERLDTMKTWNMNAMIFQVRPLLDAYYPSNVNPTSEFLSGAQGLDVDYDPLAYMVEKTHAYGMEYHAWLNPYRVTFAKITSPAVLAKIGLSTEQALALTIPEHIAILNQHGYLADMNFAVLNPNKVLRFEDKLFLNPGLPEVITHVVETVSEIITNYDVDGIHFDDYFYPYRVGDNYFGALNEDRSTFEQYGLTHGYTDTAEDLENWRRDNITSLVESIKTEITRHNKATNNAVQLGISPFGIWEHKINHPDGSNTPAESSQSYSRSIFADTYKWIKDDTLDYVVPQVYWSFGQAAAPYGELVRWWDQVVEESLVHLYIGHPNYKHLGNGSWDPEWMNPHEINNQLHFNQDYKNVNGSVLFSYNDIIKSTIETLPEEAKPKNTIKNESIDILLGDTFSQASLTPAKPWLSPGSIFPPAVSITETHLATLTDTQNIAPRFYLIYKGAKGESMQTITANPANIVSKVAASSNTIKVSLQLDEHAIYYASTIDKAFIESAFVKLPITAEETTPPIEETSPVNENSTITAKYKAVAYDLHANIDAQAFLQDLELSSTTPLIYSSNFEEQTDFKVAGINSITITAVPKTRNLAEINSLTTYVIEPLLIDVYIGLSDLPAGILNRMAKTPGSSEYANLPKTGESTGIALLLGGLFSIAGVILLLPRKKDAKR